MEYLKALERILNLEDSIKTIEKRIPSFTLGQTNSGEIIRKN